MRWIAEVTLPKHLRFVITPDSRAGFYLYVYEGGHMIRDELQDTLEQAKEQASEDFGVPMEAWMAVSSPYRWSAIVENPRPLRCVIKHDLAMGFYLLIYANEQRINAPGDYFHTLELAKDAALNEFHAPLDSWQVED